MAQSAVLVASDGVMTGPEIRELYDAHAHTVRVLLSRLLGDESEVDDLVQEVFVVAWRKLASFEGENHRAWLCGIAVRLACATRRKRRLRRALGLRELPQRPQGEADWRTPERNYEQSEASRAVYAVLDGMSDKRRNAFVLFEIQKLSGPEVALALGCSLPAFWSRLFSARQEFLARLKAQGLIGQQNDAGEQKERR